MSHDRFENQFLAEIFKHDRLKELQSKAGRKGLRGDEVFEFMYLDRKELKEELELSKNANKELKKLLERFCIKSNGVSIFARSDFRGIERAKKDIMNLYDFQCEVESVLKKI